MTFLGQRGKPLELTHINEARSPPFDLSVSSSTYLGSLESSFVPVSVNFFPGTDEVVLGGNGMHDFGKQPSFLLAGNATANGTLAILDTKKSPPTFLAVFRIGGRVDHVSVRASSTETDS